MGVNVGNITGDGRNLGEGGGREREAFTKSEVKNDLVNREHCA